jgi:hypothetical protein
MGTATETGSRDALSWGKRLSLLIVGVSTLFIGPDSGVAEATHISAGNRYAECNRDYFQNAWELDGSITVWTGTSTSYYMTAYAQRWNGSTSRWVTISTRSVQRVVGGGVFNTNFTWYGGPPARIVRVKWWVYKHGDWYAYPTNWCAW